MKGRRQVGLRARLSSMLRQMRNVQHERIICTLKLFIIPSNGFNTLQSLFLIHHLLRQTRRNQVDWMLERVILTNFLSSFKVIKISTEQELAKEVPRHCNLLSGVFELYSTGLSLRCSSSSKLAMSLSPSRAFCLNTSIFPTTHSFSFPGLGTIKPASRAVRTPPVT
jgi:hypothetical protein